MIRSILFVTALASLGVSLACQSGPEPRPASDGSGDAIRFSGTLPAVPDDTTAADDAGFALDAAAVEDDAFVGFAKDAFPPLMPDTPQHDNPWDSSQCLMCHETGVAGAPRIVHAGMPTDLLRAACRSCHVQVPTLDLDTNDPTVLRAARPRVIVDGFADNAFPPTFPADDMHGNAWMRSDCLACHERGVGGAPVVVHAGMPDDLKQARCRSCHLPNAQEDL